MGRESRGPGAEREKRHFRSGHIFNVSTPSRDSGYRTLTQATGKNFSYLLG